MALVLQLLLALEGGDELHLLHYLHLLRALALEEDKTQPELEFVNITLTEVVILPRGSRYNWGVFFP